MDRQTVEMLREMTEAPGVPGFEDEVRDIMRKHLARLGDVEYDNLGSIVCRRKGTAEAPRIMIPGHMDEIGFMVKTITSEGFIKFSPLGGWYDQVILSQRVVVRGEKGDVLGIVGSKPPHLMKSADRSKVVKRSDMFIDVGASKRDDVEKKYGIRVGDPIAPVSKFERMKNRKLLLAKAWDDRVGCGLIVSALRGLRGVRHPNTVCGVGTVMEEVGTRGAETSADVVNPDVCLVVESGIAADVPGIKDEEAQGKLGGGPILYALDGGMIGHSRLRKFVMKIADRHKIPYQVSVLEGAATDGRPIHLHARGVPSLFIGVPVRYIHSHTGLLHADDYDRTVKLLVETVRRLDAKAVRALVE